MAHITAKNYGCTPLTAWRELGYAPPVGRRQTGRITRSAQELAAYDMALTECTRKGRDLAKDPPLVEHVLMARYITELYKDRQGFAAFDDNTDGFTPDGGDVMADAVTGADALGGAE